MSYAETCPECGIEPRPEFKVECINGQHVSSCRIICKRCKMHTAWFPTEKEARQEWNTTAVRMKARMRELNATMMKLGKKKGADAMRMATIMASSIVADLLKDVDE